MTSQGMERDVLEMDISFDMERLFDDYNFDHILKEKRLDQFKQRDLHHVKYYKTAVKIFGSPQKRTRIIIAPPMETPLKHRLGIYHNVKVHPPPPVLKGSLKPSPEYVKVSTQEEKLALEGIEKITNYKSWIAERRKLRGDLDDLGLNEDLLKRKPNKTELEKRVEEKFRNDRFWKLESPSPPEIVSSPKLPDVPALTVPPPGGLQILDKFLSLNHMRLMDLFLAADKDKNWTISREEFINNVTKAEIPLTESEVDDIIITLDADLDDELTYRDLNKGLKQWRKQRRLIKRREIDMNPSTTAGQQQTKPIPSQEETLCRALAKEQIKLSSVFPKEQRVLSCKHSQEKKAAEMSSISHTEDRASPDVNKTSHSRLSDSKESIGAIKTLKELSEMFDLKEFSEMSDLNTSKESSWEGSSKMEEDISGPENTFPASQPRLQISDKVTENENVCANKNSNSKTIPFCSQIDKSLFRDTLLQLEDISRVHTTMQDLGKEVREMICGNKEKKQSAHGTRLGSSKSCSSTCSHTGTPNSLELPEPDLRPEARQSESMEAMLDMRKHNNVVLSRSKIWRKLPHEKKIAFDELPKVIKVGYKPIDDHCSESTLGGDLAEMVDQFRRERLREYFEVMKLFKERGLSFTRRTLDRVLLYPGDKPTNALQKNINPSFGPLTNELNLFSQTRSKKHRTKRRKSPSWFSRSNLKSGTNAAGASGSSNSSGTDYDRRALGLRGDSDDDDDEEEEEEEEEKRRAGHSSKHSCLTVVDVYPFASRVVPKFHKANLSSGRALIGRRVDNWMTFEEYNKYTENLPNRFKHFNRKSNPAATWPGHLLDKLRLYRDDESNLVEGCGSGMYNGRGNALFRHIAQPKRAYPGYNNDLITWPVGENGIIYGNIDEHRVVR